MSGAAVIALFAAGQPADALVITPNFGSSITGNANAAAIEGAINTAIGTIDGLYSPNNVSITVDFSYNPAAAGNLLSTTQFFYDYSYSAYKAALTADSTANLSNTNLALAVANLSKGNNANGQKDMAVAFAQALLLENYGLTAPTFVADAAVNINSNANFDFTRPVPGNQFDAIGGLEHELDEVLGGGGAGSTLNALGNPFFANKVGSLDLYRYSAGVPSFSTSSSVSSYLSIDGGTTAVVGFNQGAAPPAGCPGGDFADFAPNGAGAGQLIQNACNSTGQDEAYTTSSPEFLMEEAIGWDPTAQVVATPEPGTLALLGTSLLGFAALRRRRRQ